MTIRKVGGKHIIFSRKGKRLGSFDSRKAAQEREREIKFFKNKAKAGK